jgi:RNA polymerase sigma factor (sigma-70 family)
VADQHEQITAANLHAALIARIPRLRSRLARLLPKRLRSVVSADDVLQEVWIAADRNFPDFQEDGERAFDRWLDTIVRTKLVDAIRHARAQKRIGDPRYVPHSQTRLNPAASLLDRLRPAPRTPSRELHLAEMRHVLAIVVNRLGVARRTAILLHYVQGLSRREIARQMGRSPAAINDLLFHGLRQLEDMMGDAAKYFSDARSAEGG